MSLKRWIQCVAVLMTIQGFGHAALEQWGPNGTQDRGFQGLCIASALICWVFFMIVTCIPRRES